MHHSIHDEAHLSNRNHWLRAAVLGANDGLISTASLLVGVAAASTNSQTLLLTGMAALTAGALSMAAGEYISVSSQADTEKADLDKELHELTHNAERELFEITKIYEKRGLDHVLAHQVAIARPILPKDTDCDKPLDQSSRHQHVQDVLWFLQAF